MAQTKQMNEIITGKILIYFSDAYYDSQKGDTFQRIESPDVYDANEQYKILKNKEDNAKREAIEKANSEMIKQNFKSETLSYDSRYLSINPTGEYLLPIKDTSKRKRHTTKNLFFSANPTGEYVLLTEDTLKQSRYINKKIYNILKKDSFEVNISDWEIDFSMSRYSWSGDSKWLAILKDDKRGKKSGNSVLVVNLPTKDVKQIQLDGSIEQIAWKADSKKVIILAKEYLWAHTIGNYLNPWAWVGHGEMVQSFYIYIVSIDDWKVEKIKVAHRIDESYCYGIYWLE